jgi:5-methylcytosine-specific restriction endonuclease McrA
MSAVPVLNADCGPLHRVSLRHAIRMLFRASGAASPHCEGRSGEVAVVHGTRPDNRIGIYPIPTVVRLVSYVVTRWRRSRGPAWSRAGVLARNHRWCAYCGGAASTIDHVLPRSGGGAHEWTNTVAACDRCNNRKGSRTPAEARMPLLTRPYAPGRAALT